MTPEVIGAIAGGIVAIIGAIAGLVKWLATTFLKELKPNGGSSIKDQVTRLEKDFEIMKKHQENTDVKLDKLYELVLDHFGGKRNAKNKNNSL
jgi:hypothetical protein